MPDMVDPMEPPDVVIADTRVIADPDGKVVGIGASPPMLNILDLPQVWVDGVELPHVRSVDVELTYGRCEADYTIKVESPHISYTICTTSLTLKPKEKS